MSRCMSFLQTVLRGVYSVLAAAMLSAMWQPVAAAATYYWDTNGSTSGFGTASGTWGSSSFFSTSATGALATTSVTTTSLDDLNFGTGSAGMGLATGTITVDAAQSIGSLTYGSQSGAITLAGGTITLATAATITTNQTASINTIESVLAGASTGLTKAGATTSTLALTAANTYTGATSVTAGTLAIRGADGAIASSSGAAISGATLLLDNSTTSNSDRIASDVTLDRAGFFALTGNADADTMESFGTLGIGLGGATVTVTQANAGRVGTIRRDLPGAAQGGHGDEHHGGGKRPVVHESPRGKRYSESVARSAAPRKRNDDTEPSKLSRSLLRCVPKISS
jgi:autotransporter-associated beta strand protein